MNITLFIMFPYEYSYVLFTKLAVVRILINYMNKITVVHLDLRRNRLTIMTK